MTTKIIFSSQELPARAFRSRFSQFPAYCLHALVEDSEAGQNDFSVRNVKPDLLLDSIRYHLYLPFGHTTRKSDVADLYVISMH